MWPALAPWQQVKRSQRNDRTRSLGGEVEFSLTRPGQEGSDFATQLFLAFMDLECLLAAANEISLFLNCCAERRLPPLATVGWDSSGSMHKTGD